MKKLLLVLFAFVSTSAFADIGLATNGKKLVCFGPDNISVMVNADRTLLKYEIEGESNGPQKILKTLTTDRFVRYFSAEGVLTLTNKGDTFIYRGDSIEDALPLKCK